MKINIKSIVFFALAIAACMIVLILTQSVKAKAEKNNLSGSGNFIFKSGENEAAFYAEDVYYLQKEIAALFHEMEENENE